MMQTKRSIAFAAAFAATAVLSATGFVAGCGESDLGTDEIAQVELLSPEGSEIGIEMPTPEPARRQGEPVALQFGSTGDVDLEIQNFELIDVPDRLLYRGENTREECEYEPTQTAPPWNAANDSCETEQFCDDLTGTCLDSTIPEPPITVERESSVEFRFFLASSGGPPVECPADAPSSVPAEYADDYCGRFEIETNAVTDNDVFENGNATFYFLVDEKEASGQIAFNPMDLAFDGVQPGTTHSATLTVVNNGSDALTVNSVNFNPGAFARYISATPTDSEEESAPYEIPANQSLDLEVAIDLSDETIPDNFSVADIPERVTMNFDHSASETSDSVAIRLNTGIEQGPAIQLDKRALSFADNNSGTITIESVGSEPLVVQTLNFNPTSMGSRYSFTYDGESTDPQIQRTLQPDDSAELGIEFTENSGGIGEMSISHNDASLDGPVSVILLGQEEGGYAEVRPPAANFVYGAEQERTVVLYNRGTGELTTSPSFDDAPEGAPVDDSNFTVDGFESESPIAAGEFVAGTISFDGASGNQKTQLILQFGTNTVGEPVSVPVTVAPDPGETLEANINPLFGDQTTIHTGEPAKFDSQGSTGNESPSGDFWFLVDRPEESTFYNATQGESFAVRPDVPGTYVIGLNVVEGDLEAQDTYTLNVEEASE